MMMPIVKALALGPLGKTEIANALGMWAISGRLNQVIRGLLLEGSIQMTKPEMPNSRLQKYRLFAEAINNEKRP